MTRFRAFAASPFRVFSAIVLGALALAFVAAFPNPGRGLRWAGHGAYAAFYAYFQCCEIHPDVVWAVGFAVPPTLALGLLLLGWRRLAPAFRSRQARRRKQEMHHRRFQAALNAPEQYIADLLSTRDDGFGRLRRELEQLDANDDDREGSR